MVERIRNGSRPHFPLKQKFGYDPDKRILIANVESNSPNGKAIQCRLGNWQELYEQDEVLDMAT